MPFSNDEIIIEEKKSKLKTFIFILGVGIFLLSLFNISFCTENGCMLSSASFLMGWLGVLMGEAAISWMANPFLITTWILLAYNKKSAWFFALIALLFSASFLKFPSVIENEAGHSFQILKIGLGYWLWLLSCLVTFIGSLIIRILRY